MAKIMSQKNTHNPLLFNSQLETGMRSLIILNAAYPKSFDLAKLTWYDHIVVHTEDIEGPVSLHPNLPQRSGEILVRRRIIQDGLTLMHRLGFVTTISNENGITYQATDEAYPLIKLMKSNYACKLKDRAQWLVENVCTLSESDIGNLIAKKLGRWDIEFQEKMVTPTGTK